MSAPRLAWQVLSHVEDVMGTVASFTVYGRFPEDVQVDVIVEAAVASLHRTESLFSTWRRESMLSRYRRGDIPEAELAPEILEVLDLCTVVRELSGGWFDPWAMPGGVDPTGLAKGWAVERAIDLIDHPLASGVMLNIGGDLTTRGLPSPGQQWRIGIRDPWDAALIRSIVETGGAVATSATYERGSILIDPRTGVASCRLASATVLGPDLAIADGLATALAVAGDDGLQWLSQIPGYEAYIVRWDGSEEITWAGNLGSGPGLRRLGQG